MPNEQRKPQALDIIVMIWLHWTDQKDPNSEFNKEMHQISLNAKTRADDNRRKLEEARREYHRTVKNILKENPENSMFYNLPLDIYGLASPQLSHVDHPLRKAEEKFLLHKYSIPASDNSIENWALIGMQLAKADEGVMKIILPDKKEKRGRSKPGHSIDYERAVWKHMLDECECEISSPDDLEPIKLSGKLFTLDQLLDAYLSVFENSEYSSFLPLFIDIENELKLRRIARSSLRTSFSRGERERAKMWNS